MVHISPNLLPKVFIAFNGAAETAHPGAEYLNTDYSSSLDPSSLGCLWCLEEI